MTPERWRDDLEDEPPDDERIDERRAIASEPEPRALPVEPGDFLPWLRPPP